MRRTIFIILSILILCTAAASDSQRAKKASRTPRRTAVVKTKPKSKSKAPAKPKINTDSIEAVRQLQLRIDSLNNTTAKAKEGDVAALNLLASWYYTGHLVDKDYGMAVDLWRQAADKSDVRAMANLGTCYRLGHGVPRDTVEAARLYGKSIREGNGSLFKQCIDSAATDVFSAILIGNCYQYGDGVKKDISKAADFYAKAAAQGSESGMREAGRCYLNSSDTISAITYFLMGAELDDPVCQYHAGELMLDDGADTESAIRFIKNAAERNVPEAQDLLGTLYMQGRGVETDQQKAVQLFRQSAEQKCVSGMWNYADALINGTGTPVDFSHALALMCEAYGIENQENRTEIILAPHPLYDKYLDGMRMLLINNDLTAANDIFKQLDKAKLPEGKIMQALILASKANPKVNQKKAAKMLLPLASSNAEAAYYFGLINTSNVPATIDAGKAVTDYYGQDIEGFLTNIGTPMDESEESAD